MTRTLPRWTLAAVLLVTACPQIDPASQKATDYATRLQPLLQENSLLAERVLLQAAVVYNDEKADQAAIVDAWTSDVVPVAEHLHYQAQLVAAPDTFTDQHDELVAIWGERAKAYRDLSEAIQTGDTERWTSAKEEVKSNRLREDEFFSDLNGRLGPFGVIVDPYP